jgi:hypothetical protein
LESKEPYQLLFILPFNSDMTLLGYTNERIEIFDIPIINTLSTKGLLNKKVTKQLYILMVFIYTQQQGGETLIAAGFTSILCVVKILSFTVNF